ncbi:MAG: hypothetical protein J6J79_03580 [Lachnospiraceae bacterium]|nr:hypothetical protein [Lachnospiraceae bacterium]
MNKNTEKIKEIFNTADKLIEDRPELLSMDVDSIFDELDDGTSEMRSVRWGVMTRAKMREIESFAISNLIDFLLTVNEWDLLREYVGYILQSEYNISLINLLIEASKKDVTNEICPFVIPSLEYEKVCSVDKLDDILCIIRIIGNEWRKDRFIRKYAVLVVEQNQEKSILERFLMGYSDELEKLVAQIGRELFTKRYTDAKKWLDIYFGEKTNHCLLMGLNFLYNSLFYDSNIFEEYYSILEKELSNNVVYWKKIIPIYIQYLLSNDERVYKQQVKDKLIEIKNGSIEEKRICVLAIKYDVRSFQDCADIMNSIISVSFEKDKQILDSIDAYIEALFERDACDALSKLYQLYDINSYKDGDGFLDILSQTCALMKQKQSEILKIWWQKFLYGNVSEFNLSIEIFSKTISINNVDEFLESIEPSREELLSFLEGVCLFTIEDKKIAKLTYIIASHIKDKDFFYKYCLDNIYRNYAGLLLEFAEKYYSCEDEFKVDLARKLKTYYENIKEKINMGYIDKDFIPSADRQAIYRKSQIERNQKINKKAEENSFFANLFPSKKMKYGKRIAFIQTLQKGEKNYSVSEYMQHTVSAELPKYYINNPIEYINMRLEYLDRRRDNETDN